MVDSTEAISAPELGRRADALHQCPIIRGALGEGLQRRDGRFHHAPPRNAFEQLIQFIVMCGFDYKAGGARSDQHATRCDLPLCF